MWNIAIKHIFILKNFNNTRDFSSKSIKTLGMFYQRQTFVYKTSLLLKAQKSIIGNYPTFFFVSSSIKAKRSIAIIHKYFNSWILFFCWRNKKNAIFDYVHISCGQKIINVRQRKTCNTYRCQKFGISSFHILTLFPLQKFISLQL